jgi:hypothetical protein
MSVSPNKRAINQLKTIPIDASLTAEAVRHGNLSYLMPRKKRARLFATPSPTRSQRWRLRGFSYEKRRNDRETGKKRFASPPKAGSPINLLSLLACVKVFEMDRE